MSTQHIRIQRPISELNVSDVLNALIGGSTVNYEVGGTQTRVPIDVSVSVAPGTMKDIKMLVWGASGMVAGAVLTATIIKYTSK